jgi:hypothetical protein
MTQRFYEIWGYARALVIALVLLFALCMTISGQCWNLEVEWIGPGSPAAELDRQSRDRENERAAERVNEGSRDQRDQDRANEYYRDHEA